MNECDYHCKHSLTLTLTEDHHHQCHICSQKTTGLKLLYSLPTMSVDLLLSMLLLLISTALQRNASCRRKGRHVKRARRRRRCAFGVNTSAAASRTAVFEGLRGNYSAPPRGSLTRSRRPAPGPLAVCSEQ